MSDEQAELERLRAEVEGYRQRELDGLKSQLANAVEAANHYRAEAYRNAALGQSIAQELQTEIARLRMQLEAKDQVARSLRRSQHDAKLSRN